MLQHKKKKPVVVQSIQKKDDAVMRVEDAVPQLNNVAKKYKARKVKGWRKIIKKERRRLEDSVCRRRPHGLASMGKALPVSQQANTRCTLSS